jgi:hypothetical protein
VSDSCPIWQDQLVAGIVKTIKTDLRQGITNKKDSGKQPLCQALRLHEMSTLLSSARPIEAVGASGLIIFSYFHIFEIEKVCGKSSTDLLTCVSTSYNILLVLNEKKYPNSDLDPEEEKNPGFSSGKNFRILADLDPQHKSVVV